jgi:Mor family transcriptional regulator
LKGEVFVPKKLNDTQIAELIMKHTNGTSISALAKEYGIKWETVKGYITERREIVEKAESIKNETVTEWLKANSSRIQGLLDLCVDLLPEQLKKASARDLVGAIKILTETSINNLGKGDSGNGQMPEIEELTIKFVDNSGDDANGD